jgi:MFS family permease
MKQLSRTGRYTFRFHAFSSALDGAVNGVLSLNDIILRKTLGASDLVLTLFVTGQSAALLFPASWTDFTRGRYIRSSYIWFGILGRLTLAALLFVATPVPFAAVVVFAGFMFNALLPAQNMLFQSNYAAAERGRAFGFARRLFAGAFLVAALGAGYLLEWRSLSWRFYYPAVGVIGLASCLLLRRVKLRRLPGRGAGRLRGSPTSPDLPSLAWFQATAFRFATSLVNPFAGSLRTLRADRAFLLYESYFFLYGMAFMMLQPVIPVFLVDWLGVNYAQAATARGLILYGMFILVSPLAGKICDRSGPVRLASGAFALLALFPCALTLAHGIPALYAAFAIYGIAMAGVDMAWTMGPIHFAGKRDSTVYMGAHTALVAIRALIGAPLGMIVMRAAGTPRATFVVAGVLFLSGAIGMRRLAGRKLPLEDQPAEAAP